MLSVTFLDHDQILPNRRPLPPLPHRRCAWHLPSMSKWGRISPHTGPQAWACRSTTPCWDPWGQRWAPHLARAPPQPLAGSSPDERALLQELPTEVQGDVLAVHHTCARHGPSGRSQARGSAWPSLHIPPPPRLSLRPHVGDSKLAKDMGGEDQWGNTSWPPNPADV